jgi:uncharacterized membrane protein YgdD (TMEM256/DUF423 family)
MAYTRLLRWSALSGAAAVALGAFGAHGLKPHLNDYQAAIFEKGIQYHFIHTLAVLAIGVLAQRGRSIAGLRRSSYLFLAGIVLFSGSLYLLACRDLLPFPVDWLGPVTPIGGGCFIAGWLLLGWALRD